MEIENALAVDEAAEHNPALDMNEPTVQSELAPALISLRNMGEEIDERRKEPATHANETKKAELEVLVARRDELMRTVVSQLADHVVKSMPTFSLLDPARVDWLAGTVKHLGQLDESRPHKLAEWESRAHKLAEWALCEALSLPTVDSKNVTFSKDQPPIIKGFNLDDKQFELVEGCGKGSFAEVTYFKHGDEIVALKAMQPLKQTSQFSRNAELARETWMQYQASSDPPDPTVIRPRGMLRLSNGELVLVMDCARNGSVDDLYENFRKAKSSPPMLQAMELGVQALDAGVALHDKRIAHGDIKPDNLLINETADPRNAIPKKTLLMADFGSAGASDDPAPDNSKLPHRYRDPAPKLGYKNVTRGDEDRWRWGITLFTMVSGGVVPFNQDFGQHDDKEKEDYDRMTEKEKRDRLFSKYPDVPKDAQNVILGLLQTDPSKRWSLKKVRYLWKRSAERLAAEAAKAAGALD